MLGASKPGSAGEHVLQEQCGTTERAGRFHEPQLSGCLTPPIREFIRRMKTAFIATSDGTGERDCSFRARRQHGVPG